MASKGNTVYKCVSCGSTSLEIGSDGLGECLDCGAKFSANGGLVRVKVCAETTKKDFIRAAWIYLAAKDAPLDVFGEDFGEVVVAEYQTVTDTREVRVPYTVTIGTDRQEPYIAYETYYEKEPYLATENVYDKELKRTVQRTVTRYRNVKKEREVTKYKTVTDWTPISSVFGTKSEVSVENGEGKISRSFDVSGEDCDSASGAYGEVTLGGEREGSASLRFSFNRSEFLLRFKEASRDALTAPDEDECGRMKLTPSAKAEIEDDHSRNIYAGLKSSIKGDHFRDLSYTTDVTKSSTCICLVPEFDAGITYGGIDYAVRAYPFGRLVVRGDRIPNAEGTEEFARQKKKELSEGNKRISDEAEERMWQQSRGLLTAAMVLLILSIVGSVVLSVLSLGTAVVLSVVLTLFAAALVVFICSRVYVGRRERKITSERDETAGDLESRIRSEIESFTTDYKNRQLELLNGKLESLGLKPATLGDIR